MAAEKVRIFDVFQKGSSGCVGQGWGSNVDGQGFTGLSYELFMF